MITLTQLVYIHPGKEAAFDRFEAVALPLVEKHGGTVVLRLRPTAESVISSDGEPPYEVHIVRFPSDEALDQFSRDPARQALLHLKNESVRSAVLVKGSG